MKRMILAGCFALALAPAALAQGGWRIKDGPGGDDSRRGKYDGCRLNCPAAGHDNRDDHRSGSWHDSRDDHRDDRYGSGDWHDSRGDRDYFDGFRDGRLESSWARTNSRPYYAPHYDDQYYGNGFGGGYTSSRSERVIVIERGGFGGQQMRGGPPGPSIGYRQSDPIGTLLQSTEQTTGWTLGERLGPAIADNWFGIDPSEHRAPPRPPPRGRPW